ncbi:ArnT family glycosyltransferase [Pigmentiphaga kullae]|uniref:Dolichyl-phosphate-mannose-protein mannosyltransferase n=1 Tax=Pigmentiphaga kullae TaxID=151784 RepID=A0A4Q7NN03_9BURK|nr:glycosyltransferase family 39 protein [Pigmentiphaga kullae]RZS86579.1 dolichyl-phosphate-mannose-protein mannosyltransferase [Pigmentiphaga kullae]
MSSTTRLFVVLLGAAVGVRLLAMYLLPFIDTSEPRYAEIARLMVETGNWVTPWFSPDVPFWGKPPLSFWAQAASFSAFGITEIAGRLPSLIAAVLTGALTFAYLRITTGLAGAMLAAWILATSLLSFVAAGAVLTDPFLALGTTLSMVSFRLALQGRGRCWGYGFFLGIAVGLLAKGPLVLALTGGPLLAWLCVSRGHWRSLAKLPWVSGLLLTAVLVLPWYVMAEIRTPGFVQYFVVGEHLLRFIEPGWKGDLYGSAHLKPFGAIWWNWAMAAFPWSLLPLVGVIGLVRERQALDQVRTRMTDEVKYLAAWALFPMLFFTFAHNILWTYVLPGLPAFAMLCAMYVRAKGWSLSSKGIVAAGALVPSVCLVLSLVVHDSTNRVKTERELIGYAQSRGAGAYARLVYVNDRPFSARFYSAGRAERVELSDLAAELARSRLPVNLAVPRSAFAEFSRLVPDGWRVVYENKRYFLVVFTPPDAGRSSSKFAPIHVLAP